MDPRFLFAVTLAAACAFPAASAVAAVMDPAAEACFELAREHEDPQLALDCSADTGVEVPPELRRQLELAADPALDAALQEWNAAIFAATRARADALAARGDGRSLLAASLMASAMPHPDSEATGAAPGLPAPAAEWFRQAREARPVEPLVRWVEATGCIPAAVGCDTDAGLRWLLEHEGSNAAVHLLALDAATEAGDPVAARTHLRLAAAAERFDPHTGGLLALMQEAYSGVEVPPVPTRIAPLVAAGMGGTGPVDADDVRGIGLLATWAAFAIPALQPVTRTCREVAASDTALRSDCLAVLEKMAGNGDSLLFPAFGLSLLSQLTAHQPAGALWRERLRRHYWLYQQALGISPGLGNSATRVGEHAGRVVEHGEVGAMRMLLRDHGIAVDPPDDWLPGNPRQRALVTTGVVPAG